MATEPEHAEPGRCSVDGWCWRHPRPAGAEVFELDGLGPDDFWALAENMILHWHGGRWSVHRSCAGRVTAMYIAGPTLVFFAGETVRSGDEGEDQSTEGNTLCRWNGGELATWSEIDGFASYVSMWGNGSDDVWLLGGVQGAFITPCSSDPDSMLFDEHCDEDAPPETVLHHWDGNAMTAVGTPEGRVFTEISEQNGAMHLVGPEVARRDGEEWQLLSGALAEAVRSRARWGAATPPTEGELSGMRVGEVDVFDASHGLALLNTNTERAVLHLGPDGWERRTPDLQLGWSRAIWMGAADHTLIAESGQISLFDGNRTTPHPGSSSLSARPGIAAWGPDPEHLFVLTRSGVLRLTPEGDSYDPLEGGRDIHGLALDDVWVAGETTQHWDGSTWSEVETPEVLRELDAIDGTLYAISENALYRREGEGFEEVHRWGVRLRDLSTVEEGDLWVLGGSDSGARSYHFDGERWTESEHPGRPQAITGDGAGSAYVSTRTQLVHGVGDSWRALPLPEYNHILPGFCDGLIADENELWCVASEGYAFRWDGTTWTADETGTRESFEAIAWAGAAHFVAVGGGRWVRYGGRRRTGTIVLTRAR